MSASPRAGVGHCEGVQGTKAAQLLLVVFKGEQYLIHLPFLGLNMAFDNNVTKNLLWYNSKPQSCLELHLCSLQPLGAALCEGSLRTLGQWQPLAALPTPCGSCFVPRSVTRGPQVFIVLSHFWH